VTTRKLNLAMTKSKKNVLGLTSGRAVLVPVLTVLFLVTGLSAAEAKRLALVVGNSAYTGVSPLKNASRDATDISEALQRLGFEVTLLTDIGGEAFWEKIDAFSIEAETAESTVFFYSGHAFQMNGTNYLVPVDAKLTSREAVRTETWNLDGIIARLQDRKRQTLIFLDACRNDPLPASVRGSGTAADGLARLQTGVGTFVAFATEPGAVTFDGAGDAPNSPFTTALLEHIEAPGISVSDMMIRVRNEVEERTLRRQTPWDQSSLREQFYFTPPVESKQELSEADYELLAQLPAEDRKKFMDLLRASGFSDASLRAADASIEVASLNLELAADDGGVSIGSVEGPQTAGDVVLGDAGNPTLDPEVNPEEPVVFDIVDGGVTIGDAPAVAPDMQMAAVDPAPAVDPASVAPPTVEAAAPAEAPVTALAEGPAPTIASVEETNLALLPQPPANANADARVAATGEEPIRLAALSWETRGIIGINALTVNRLRVSGRDVSPDVESDRALLAAIDPRLLDQDTAQTDTKGIALATQAELRRLGCYQIKVDGDWGRGSRTALTSYYLAKRAVPDTLEPTPELLDQLRRESKVVCEVRVARVVPKVKVAPKVEAVSAAPKSRIKAKPGRTANAPAVVKKEMKKSLLNSGSF